MKLTLLMAVERGGHLPNFGASRMFAARQGRTAYVAGGRVSPDL